MKLSDTFLPILEDDTPDDGSQLYVYVPPEVAKRVKVVRRPYLDTRPPGKRQGTPPGLADDLEWRRALARRRAKLAADEALYQRTEAELRAERSAA